MSNDFTRDITLRYIPLMPIFKSYDYGHTYINLDRVEMFTSDPDPDYPNNSYIYLVGAKQGIHIHLPITELLQRLDIPVHFMVRPKRKPEPQEEKRTEKHDRRSLGLRDFEEVARERRHEERELEAQKKPAHSERRKSNRTNDATSQITQK